MFFIWWVRFFKKSRQKVLTIDIITKHFAESWMQIWDHGIYRTKERNSTSCLFLALSAWMNASHWPHPNWSQRVRALHRGRIPGHRAKWGLEGSGPLWQVDTGPVSSMKHTGHLNVPRVADETATKGTNHGARLPATSFLGGLGQVT